LLLSRFSASRETRNTLSCGFEQERMNIRVLTYDFFAGCGELFEADPWGISREKRLVAAKGLHWEVTWKRWMRNVQ
jgi:hypothetical protein